MKIFGTSETLLATCRDRQTEVKKSNSGLETAEESSYANSAKQCSGRSVGCCGP